MRYTVFFAILMTLLMFGCVQSDPLAGYCKENEKPVVICEPIPLEETNTTSNETSNTIIVIGNVTTTTTTTLSKPNIDYAATLTYEEGDLIDLSNIKAADPDNDNVTLTFGQPLDSEGVWQTSSGDIGTYTVKVIASDGKAETVDYILLSVTKKNMPPTLMIENDDITVMEGDTISIKATVTDPEGENVVISYSGWMSSPEYTTTYTDAGKYVVTVTARDTKNVVTKDVEITVKNKNRAPVIDMPTYDVIAIEGDTIQLQIDAYDPDGDSVKLKYDKPFDKTGRWVTEKGDAGTYSIEVTASDGDDSSSIEVPVVVEKLNHAPVLEPIAPIEVNEGDTIIINVKATDEDEDDLDVTFSGWMDSSSYMTTYDDAGDHIVTVTVSDGLETVSQDISIKVHDVNRPPVFVWG